MTEVVETPIPVVEPKPPSAEEIRRQKKFYHEFLKEEIKQLELETKFYELKLIKIEQETKIKTLMPDELKNKS